MLSNYMYSWEWTEFLAKLGKEPVMVTNKLHRLGIDAILCLAILYGTSITQVHNKSTNMRASITNKISSQNK